MPCPSQQRVLNGTPTNPVIITQTKKKPREKPFLEDFYCEVCGLVAPGRHKNYYHLCTGPKKIPFVEQRLSQCNVCPENVDDICQKYKEEHPERDCRISVGVKMPISACPLDKWKKQSIYCPKCSKHSMIKNGVIKCRFCKWKPS